jgi:hypothetical protein
VCHVVPKGRNCVAAMSSDNVPVLISLDARIVLVGPEGRRELPLEDYYHGRRPRPHAGAPGRADGRAAGAAADRAAAHDVHQVVGAQEHRLPAAERGAALRPEQGRWPAPHAEIAGIKVVAGVLGAKPHAQPARGRARQAALGPGGGPHRQRGAYAQCKPLENVPYEAATAARCCACTPAAGSRRSPSTGAPRRPRPGAEMCTLLLAWQVDPARPLIVAANRDEFTRGRRRPRASGAGGAGAARRARPPGRRDLARRDPRGPLRGADQRARARCGAASGGAVAGPPRGRNSCAERRHPGRISPASTRGPIRRLQPGGRRRGQSLWHLSNRSGERGRCRRVCTG